MQLTAPDYIQDAAAEALQRSLCFLSTPGHSRHVPFTFTPCPVSQSQLAKMQLAASLLGRLTQALASDAALIQGAHAHLAAGDPFFAEMLSMHRELHGDGTQPCRVPLLLQRSDFMDDGELGIRLIECNSIAAGMGPFGQRIHELHGYLQNRWPEPFERYSATGNGQLLRNEATERLAEAISRAAHTIAGEPGQHNEPGFLMVVQENEDNIFDQRILEAALRQRGVRTYTRTFRQLHNRLRTGPNESLLLEDGSSVHAVYLRAGYQYQDYIATDLDTRSCCDALRATRIFIERHRVAVNATIAQQLATSKRMQLELVSGGGAFLSRLGFTSKESNAIQSILAPMKSVTGQTSKMLQDEAATAQWVLKNQGEGGGHCLFDQQIIELLQALPPENYGAWTLMRRLRPTGRQTPTLIVRDGEATEVADIVSEIGLFTAHLGDDDLAAPSDLHGSLGYLVRSKPATVTEGGIHSGFGALDSLALID